MSSIGDVDGDGVTDFAVGAPRRNNSRGAIYVYSGLAGKLIKTIWGPKPGAAYGSKGVEPVKRTPKSPDLLLIPAGAPSAVHVYSLPAFGFERELPGSMCCAVGSAALDGSCDIATYDLMFEDPPECVQLRVFVGRTLQTQFDLRITGELAEAAARRPRGLRMRPVPDFDAGGAPGIALGSDSGTIALFSVRSGEGRKEIQLRSRRNADSIIKNEKLEPLTEWNIAKCSGRRAMIVMIDPDGEINLSEVDLENLSQHQLGSLGTAAATKIGRRLLRWEDHLALFAVMGRDLYLLTNDSPSEH